MAPGRATAACGWSGYSYAGVQSLVPAHGVSARLTAVSVPRVQSGHVAAWVGVGGAGLGRNGADEWLQVGLSAYPGTRTELYYELAQPGSTPAYHVLDASVAAGTIHRVAVLEMRGRPDVWRAWVDGSAVSPPLYLPGSHGAWRPVATAETWDGGRPACNGYGYRFDEVRVATRAGGAWIPLSNGRWLESPGYRVRSRTAAAFVASRP
jgi:hypothetical protein